MGFYKAKLITLEQKFSPESPPTWKRDSTVILGEDNKGEQELPKAIIRQKINAISSFSFDITPKNQNYEKVSEHQTFIEVYKNEKCEFDGRVLRVIPEMSSDGMIVKHVVCEDFAGFLHDSVQPYREPSLWEPMGDLTGVQRFINELLELHNGQVESWKQIKPGKITVNPFSTGAIRKGTNYQTTFDCLKTKLIDAFGGEMRIRKVGNDHFLDYVQSFEEKSENAIEVGVNMVDISQENEMASMITRLIPLGAKIDETEARVTIPDMYIENTEAVKKWGIKYGTVEFKDVHNPETLEAKARDYFERLTIPQKNKVSALDLSRINKDFAEFQIGICYPIKNKYLNIETEARVVAREINLIDPTESTMELGETPKSLSDLASRTEVAIEDVKEDFNREKSLRKQMESELDNKIKNSNGLYFTENEVESGKEFYLHSNPIMSQSDIIWRMTREAMAVSTDYGKTYSAGMTMDGNVIANIISAIGIDASWIRAGRIESKDKKSYWDLENNEFHMEALSYIRANAQEGYVEIGEPGEHKPSIRIDNRNGIRFFTETGEEAARMEAKNLKISSAIIFNSLRIGDFGFETSGEHVLLRKVV